MLTVNYDEISKVYDKVRFGDPLVVEYILKHSKLNEPARILEIGCGTGNNTALLASTLEAGRISAEVWGFDQSEGMLQKVREKNAGIKLLQGDAVLLAGVPEDAFDVIFMVDVIHHIQDIKTMFGSIHKALKTGGKVFVFTDTHERIKHERLTSKYFPETVGVELKRYQADNEIEHAMEQAGFSGWMLEYIGKREPVDFGQRLIDTAATKGYSMFHLIPQEAIERGIEKLREDLKKGPVFYTARTPVFIGSK